METQAQLEAHERECALRYTQVEKQLSGLDKRLWRLEAMIMGSTVSIVAVLVVLFMNNS